VWQGTVVAVKKLPGYFIELREEESAAFLDNFQKEASIMKCTPLLLCGWSLFTCTDHSLLLCYL
jgi:hypothetical protein